MNTRTKRCWNGIALAVVALLVANCSGSNRQQLQNKVTIDSAPVQGATVYVDWEERGVTPVTIVGLTPGTHNVQLQMEEYEVKVDQIEVSGDEDQVFKLRLKPHSGTLTLDSTPKKAEVFIDGVLLGLTPIIRHELGVGEHTYEIRKQGYYPVVKELEVEKSNRYEYAHILEPMEAQLVVLSQPSGANIWLNNQLQEEKTPAKFTLKPDIYMVSVYTEGYVQSDQTFELTPDEEKQVTLKMIPGTAPPGMLLVPAGEFLFGEDKRAPDEKPRRKIYLDAFYIDKYEVTNSQFKEVFPDHSFGKGEDAFPVRGVTWYQARDYALKVGKRLPTEAEWEKAARGTDAREFPWGATFDKKRCNSKESNLEGLEGPVFVGKMIQGISPYGCMDMAGNVYEWVQDWYQAYPGNTDVETDYGQVFRVLRGGSFLTPQFQVRCARRHFDKMENARKDYGFRCAKDVE